MSDVSEEASTRGNDGWRVLGGTEGLVRVFFVVLGGFERLLEFHFGIITGKHSIPT